MIELLLMRIHRVREPVFIPVTRGRSLKSNGLLNKAKHSRRVSVKGQLEKFNRNYKMSVFTLGLEKSGRVNMRVFSQLSPYFLK